MNLFLTRAVALSEAGWPAEVLSWYRVNRRRLPWRETTDPYKILVSEIMLQQTQADRVISKYQAFMSRFPTVNDLAETSLAEILQLWSGLGYNRRAKFLQKAAQQLTYQIPNTQEEWQKLPGVGPYTAAAIMAFSQNVDVVVTDTNITRVYQLLLFGDQTKPTGMDLGQVGQLLLPMGRARDWYNALMDLGASILKMKGAKAQQQALTSLFPGLKALDLPELSATSLKRPKQSSFFGSRRYFRGSVLKLLQAEARVSLDSVVNRYNAEALKNNIDLAQVISALVKEGLIEQEQQTLSLPGKALIGRMGT